MSKPARGAMTLPTLPPATDLFGRTLGAAVSGPFTVSIHDTQPDPTQARWVLPPTLRAKFLAGDLTAPAALQAWQAVAAREPVEATRLGEIAALARSLSAGGQVNPISVVRQGQGWRIETGERRFWAHVYLVVVEKDAAAAAIPAIEIAQIDPFRQAVENLHVAPLNAIGLARETARLLLSAAGTLPANLTWATYRQAAQQRVPRGGWARIEGAMGKSEEQLARLVRLLLLPEPALHLADRHDLPEKVLRPVLKLTAPAEQTATVQLIVECGLSTPEVDWLVQQPEGAAARAALRAQKATPAGAPAPSAPAKAPRPTPTAAAASYQRFRGLHRFTQQLTRQGAEPATVLAQALLTQAPTTAAADLQATIAVLEAALAVVQARQPAAPKRKK